MNFYGTAAKQSSFHFHKVVKYKMLHRKDLITVRSFNTGVPADENILFVIKGLLQQYYLSFFERGTQYHPKLNSIPQVEEMIHLPSFLIYKVNVCFHLLIFNINFYT